MKCALSDLAVGQTATVAGYDTGHPEYRARLLSMGLTRGTAVRVTGVAPLGDPVQVEVRGYALTLRRDEARVLILETGPPEAPKPR